MAACRKRNGESGFALLLVFLMAAVIAIALYKEIPRVAFQSQRHREQLLIERGEQFKRGIQVFRTTYPGQWPRDLDELETGHNRHFIRHRYVDPMTGKAEWRLVHIQGNVLTDSILTKKKDGQSSGGMESSVISATPVIGDAAGQTGVRPQDRRRASEGGAGGDTSMGGVPPGMPQPFGNPPDATNPNAQQPGAPGYPNSGQLGAQTGVPGQPGYPQGGMPFPQPGMPGQPAPQPGQPGYNPQMPGMPQNPGQSPVNPVPAAAANMIQDMLTRPNPAGLAQVRAQQQAAASGGSISGGLSSSGGFSASPLTGGGQGIAGVASKAELEGIMVYNDRTAYNEWEFIFDPAKAPRTGLPTSNAPSGSIPVSQMGTANPNPGARSGLSGGMGGGTGQTGANSPAGMQTGGLPMGGGTGATIRMGRP
jgi:hypothetical protein